MAVYTEVGKDALEAFLAAYDVGTLESCKGIAEGIENSNFLLKTSQGVYILTLYEKRVNSEDLPFFLGFLDYLGRRGIACPRPISGRDGDVLRTLCGRPAAVVSFLHGAWPRRISVRHCRQVGQVLADLHLTGADYEGRRVNDLSVWGWRPLFEETKDRIDAFPGLARMIVEELDFLEARWPSSLPKGIIHADLFPDNVFFLRDKLSGVIDFYFACYDLLAYDLAVCLNAWCFESDAVFSAARAKALVGRYRECRPLAEEELAALPVLCRGAALRFLLTRLHDWFHIPEGAFATRKDPLEYARKLSFHRSVAGAGAYGID